MSPFTYAPPPADISDTVGTTSSDTGGTADFYVAADDVEVVDARNEPAEHAAADEIPAPSMPLKLHCDRQRLHSIQRTRRTKHNGRRLYVH